MIPSRERWFKCKLGLSSAAGMYCASPFLCAAVNDARDLAMLIVYLQIEFKRNSLAALNTFV